MYRNLEQVTLELRKEMYGLLELANEIDADAKFEDLMANLKLHSPELILDDDWSTQIKPLMIDICKIPNVRITKHGNAMIFELEDGKLKSTAKPCQTVPIASISGFVNEIKRLTIMHKDFPEQTYFFLHNFRIDRVGKLKTVRYFTHTTANPILSW